MPNGSSGNKNEIAANTAPEVRVGRDRFERVFLLSPARIGGPRSIMLLRDEAEFDLAVRLREGIATVGEIYAFISGLYFRGKVAYAGAFGFAPVGITPAMVIVPGMGLVPPDTVLTHHHLRTIGNIPVEADNAAFSIPFLRDASLLNQRAGPACKYVLLGSIATEKYTRHLLEVFGDRLLFPAEFVGRGDMSRGGLMVRSAHASEELSYVPVQQGVRRGKRPPKLKPLR